MNFDEAFELVIGHEGGYVNDPSDPGGETKYGISKRSYPDVDIKSLKLEDAKQIYLRDYWVKLDLHRFHESLRFHLFDAAVNSGVRLAIQFLQRAVGVADDGVIGPITVAAVSRKDPNIIAVRLNAERLRFIAKLSTFKQFGRGWSSRIVSNLRMIGG